MKTLAYIFLFIAGVGYGQTVENFTLPDVSTGEQASLNDLATGNIAVVIFTSNACPYDGYYLSRIKQMQQQYGSRVPLILVNPHLETEESIDAMKAYLVRSGLSIPYLADKDQVVMTLFNARKSPEAFLLQKINGKFTVMYHGAIDDNPQSANDVKTAFLKNSIDQVLDGQKPSLVEERPVGCSIRKKQG